MMGWGYKDDGPKHSMDKYTKLNTLVLVEIHSKCVILTEVAMIVSVSGIRGIVGEGLTSGAALKFASALGTYLQGGRVVLSRDSRPSGRMLRHAVLAGLLEAGCEVVDIGIAPTPTVGVAVSHWKAAGGIQITASHNPAPWNGLKMFGADGAVLTAVRGGEVKQIYEAGPLRQVAWNALGEVILTDMGTATYSLQVLMEHRDRVLELVDVPLIRRRGLRVFLDANGGAGGALGQLLLDALNASPQIQGCEPDGVFAHPPEPLAENLQTVLAQVPESRADIGFVLDPDADRLAIIDERGRYIGEELTLALAVLLRLRQAQGPIVINMSTSRVSKDLAEQAGCTCHRSRRWARPTSSRRCAQVGALIGGEGNGGVIDPRVGWVRDPFIGMGLILNLLAETGKKVSELVAELPSYAIVKDKYALAARALAEPL